MGRYHWYYSWNIGHVVIHTSDNKVLQDKKMSDLSIYLMSLIASGLFLWIIYKLIRSDLVLIGTNAAGLGLNVTLLITKLRYDKL